MSTNEGVLRHVNTAAEVGIASLAMKDTTTQLDEIKSKVHYFWNPFGDIPLVGPDGLRFRLGRNWSYYGVGTPGEIPDEYFARGGDKLMRCLAYPLWNIYYKETRYNLGKFTDEQGIRGQDFGAEAQLEDKQKFAGVCAADLLDRYADDWGARVLVPFIGMDDEQQETVAELFRLVQPRAYKLTNLREEEEYGEVRDEETLLFDLKERGPADERIRGAKLDAVLEPKAHAVRKILYGGARVAANTARKDWADFLGQLSNSAMGQKGYKKGPSAHDYHVAFLLGETVPATVSARPQQPTGMAAVEQFFENLNAKGVLPQAGGDVQSEAQQALAEIRAEREALRKEREELEALRTAKKK